MELACHAAVDVNMKVLSELIFLRYSQGDNPTFSQKGQHSKENQVYFSGFFGGGVAGEEMKQ